MVDTRALRAAMYKAGYFTIGKLAKDLGKSPYNIGQKISGKRDFTIAEADKICELLKIENNETKAIIFLSKGV